MFGRLKQATLLFDLKSCAAKRIMNTLTQVLNPITGSCEWEPQDDTYDYQQEIASAAFADMLHDTERNVKYSRALAKAITKMKARGEKAHVLDIGTGTGLLSMMAVYHGADSVVACEAFEPMAHCAEKIITKNRMSLHIKLIKKRSTDVVVGAAGDMPRRANILVTELFDTELIGEGALGTFLHAHEYLLERDCIVVPHSGTMYAQVVESSLVKAWDRPKALANLEGEIILQTPPKILECPGSSAVHDLQLSQLSLNDFKTLVKPTPVFEFDWSGKTSLLKNRSSAIPAEALTNGHAHAVFMWWDLSMDQEGDIILSCAPYWAHPDHETLLAANTLPIPPQNVIPWRDHWMQAIYYLPDDILVEKEQKLEVIANHDEYSLWFDLRPTQDMNYKSERPNCECGFHIAFGRSRIGNINDHGRNKKFITMMDRELSSESVVLSLSDGSLLGMATGAFGVSRVYCLEQNRLARQAMELYKEHNHLENVRVVESFDDIDEIEKITHIIGEPYFIMSLVPWDNLYFGTLLKEIKEKLAPNVRILPQQTTIHAVAVEFLDLHKIRAPLGECEGFNLTIFDNLIESASTLVDDTVEPQPLWEYPCRALGCSSSLVSINLTSFENTVEESGLLDLTTKGVCNGIALWTDWSFDGASNSKLNISSGPTETISAGKFIVWDRNTRQGVHFIRNPRTIRSDDTLRWHVKFSPQSGAIKFQFTLEGVYEEPTFELVTLTSEDLKAI